jgi:DNA-binding PadR family transcriptional regulator
VRFIKKKKKKKKTEREKRKIYRLTEKGGSNRNWEEAARKVEGGLHQRYKERSDKMNNLLTAVKECGNVGSIGLGKLKPTGDGSRVASGSWTA